MPLPRSIGAYADIPPVLNPVMASKKVGIYKLANRAAAVRWCQRAYTFRKLLQEQTKRQSGGVTTETPYDMMALTVTGTSVRIDPCRQPEGTLMLDEGRGATINPTTADAISIAPAGEVFPEAADLMAAALDLSVLNERKK